MTIAAMTIAVLALAGPAQGADAGAPAAAGAGSPPAALRDPWVPPSTRKLASTPPTRGVVLKAQVEQKLRASFAAADVDGQGTLTREQARAGGLGVVANHFERIDATHRGRVSFDDLVRYLREQGAEL